MSVLLAWLWGWNILYHARFNDTDWEECSIRDGFSLRSWKTMGCGVNQKYKRDSSDPDQFSKETRMAAAISIIPPIVQPKRLIVPF